MAYGVKQTATIDVLTAGATDIVVLTGLEGAVGVLMRLSGGSNSANALSAGTFQLGDSGMTQGGSAGPVLVPDVTITTVKTNKALPNGDYVVLRYAPGGAGSRSERIPLPSCAVRLQMGTADSTGVVCDFWPVFDHFHSQRLSLPT